MRVLIQIAAVMMLLSGCGLGGGSTTAAVAPPAVNTSLLPKVKRCPSATGTLSGSAIGLAHLGMTRAQAQHAYSQSTVRGTPNEDFFCLTPIGVRVAYPSPALLNTLSASEQALFRGRVIWASTGNRHYSIGSIRPGTPLSKAGALHLTGPIPIGRNAWYFAEEGSSTFVLKVEHHVIEEVGIAARALTGSLAADSTLIHSLPAIGQGS